MSEEKKTIYGNGAAMRAALLTIRDLALRFGDGRRADETVSDIHKIAIAAIAEDVRTVDALTEEEFLNVVLKIIGESEDLVKLGDHVMKLVRTVATCVVRLAYDRKVAVVRENA